MVLLPSLAGAAHCAGRSCGGALLPSAVVTAFSQVADATVDDSGHLHPADASAGSHELHADVVHRYEGGASFDDFLGGTSVHDQGHAHTAFLGASASHFLAGPVSDEVHAVWHGASHAATDSAGSTAFLAEGGPQGLTLTPEQLEQRQTQLRVAMGISATTLMTSVGLAGRAVYQLAKKHMDKLDAEEQEADEGALSHEADFSAGLRPKAAGGLRFTVYNRPQEDRVEDEVRLDARPDEEVAGDQAFDVFDGNSEVLAYY